MKKTVFIIAVVLILVAVFAVAALTQVEIDRDIKVSVASDTDPDVAIKFTVGAGYEDVAYLTDDNKIEFDLGGALSADHYNTEAVFVIGSTENWVFSVTNNSDVTITINTEHGSGPENVLELLDSEGNTDEVVLGSGESEEFHFRLNTAGAMAGTDDDPVQIAATLVIRKQ